MLNPFAQHNFRTAVPSYPAFFCTLLVANKQSPATPKEAQVANALGEVGPSVMIGAATTFLGIMPMAFAKNFVFRVFFKIFILTIVFGVRDTSM